MPASESLLIKEFFNKNECPFCLPTELLAEGLMSKAVDVYAYGVLLWELFVGDRWVQRSC